MKAIKKLGIYLQTAEDFLFGRDEDLRVTGVKAKEATEYGSLMLNPRVLAQLILTTGHAPRERVKKIALVEVTAQNTAGKNFCRTYRFADPERAAGFAQTMRDYQKEGDTLYVQIHNRRNRLPGYLPLVV